MGCVQEAVTTEDQLKRGTSNYAIYPRLIRISCAMAVIGFLRKAIYKVKQWIVCIFFFVVVLFFLIDIRSRSHSLSVQFNSFARQLNIIPATPNRSTAFAVIAVVEIRNSDSVHQLAQTTIDRHLQFPECTTIHRFKLHLVITYPKATAAAFNQSQFLSSLNEGLKRCNPGTSKSNQIDVSAMEMINPTLLRNIILDAYLDDIEYFNVVVWQGLGETTSKYSNLKLNLLRDILLKKSPDGIGVVTMEKTAAVFGVFFSKIHLEIFGAAFPVGINSLDAALSYVTSVYPSIYVSKVRNGKLLDSEGLKSVRNETPYFDKYQLTEQCRQDAATLSRYLSEFKNRKDDWRTGRQTPSSQNYVISMSLYGSDRRYTIGALRNAQLYPVIFPGWRLRFYCEEPRPDGSVRFGAVPKKIMTKIRQLGAEMRYVSVANTGLAPMLWRFLVAEDIDVDGFTVRDCDSRLTPRDSVVVKDWLRTNTSFHCIRDHPSHSDHAISGGLWGGRPRELVAILNGTMKTVMKRYSDAYWEDMTFLGNYVWPKVKDFAFCHDSVSCQKYPSSHPFPVKREGSEHLGQVFDENSIGRQSDINSLKSRQVNVQCSP